MNLEIRCSDARISSDRRGVNVELSGVNVSDLDKKEIAKEISLETILKSYTIHEILQNYSYLEILKCLDDSDIIDYIGEDKIISEARKYKIDNILKEI